MPNKSAEKRVLILLIVAILLMIPVFSLAAGLSEKDVGAVASITASELKVREKANSSSKVLFTLKKSAKVTLLSYTNGWFQIQADNKKTGYASASYLKIVTPAPGVDAVVSPQEAVLSVSSAPSPTPSGIKSGGTLGLGDSSSEVTQVQEKLKELGYYTYENITGYYGDMTAEAVENFQRDAGLPVTGEIDSLTSQRIFSESNKVSVTPQGTSQPNTTPAPTQTPETTQTQTTETQASVQTVSNTDQLDGPPVSDIAFIQDGTTNTSDLGYEDNDDEESYTAPPPPDAPLVDGKAPIPVITKVEKLNWFPGNGDAAQDIFKKGMTAIITDVRTGITFTAKRLGGSNHADSEPLTQFDTSQMFKAYGNAWKWDRRPILVTVGGRTIAASMNGMPHGGSSISTNKFNGHFCIHFVKSRTHGTNKLCPLHQAAIEEAYRYAQKNNLTLVSTASTANSGEKLEQNTDSNSTQQVALPTEDEVGSVEKETDPYALPVDPQ